MAPLCSIMRKTGEHGSTHQNQHAQKRRARKSSLAKLLDILQLVNYFLCIACQINYSPTFVFYTVLVIITELKVGLLLLFLILLNLRILLK